MPIPGCGGSGHCSYKAHSAGQTWQSGLSLVRLWTQFVANNCRLTHASGKVSALVVYVEKWDTRRASSTKRYTDEAGFLCWQWCPQSSPLLQVLMRLLCRPLRPQQESLAEVPLFTATLVLPQAKHLKVTCSYVSNVRLSASGHTTVLVRRQA